MVDTPRTLAEVKAILADNNTGDITPQDLRDLVESIVDPVIDGGFPSIHYPTDAFHLSFFDDVGISLNDGSGRYFDIFDIENNFATKDSWNPKCELGMSDGGPNPAPVVRLPAGLWAVSSWVNWTSGSGSGKLESYPFVTDERYELDILMNAPHWLNALTSSAVAQVNGAGYSQSNLAIVAAPPALIAQSLGATIAGAGLGVSLWSYNGSGSVRSIDSVYFSGYKIGNLV